MRLAEELGVQLARDVLEIQRKLGEERLVEEVAKLIGSSSQTLEEEFLTAARVIQSEERAREFLERRVEEALKRVKARTAGQGKPAGAAAPRPPAEPTK